MSCSFFGLSVTFGAARFESGTAPHDVAEKGLFRLDYGEITSDSHGSLGPLSLKHHK